MTRGGSLPARGRPLWGAFVRIAALAFGASSYSPLAAAVEQRQIEVRVVELAGGRAYLTPGADRHVRVGDQVRLQNRRYVVIARNQTHIVIDLRGHESRRGQRGVVTVSIEEEKTFKTRPAPRPLQAFAEQWRPPRLPAESQAPRLVPLGVMTDRRRQRAAFVVDHQRIQPLSGPSFGIGRTRLRALLHAELASIPLSLDADAVAEFWQAPDLELRPKNASRPFLTVRQLELGYRGESLQAAVGRLRYASSTLGMLDGGRAAAALTEHLSVAAFGGLLADPLDGSLDTDASRFGAELGWRDEGSPLRPRAHLTLQGSRFLGNMDERRVTGLLEAYPKDGRIGARAEVSFFDPDNPWAAAPTELSAAGLDASVRFDELRLGAAFDMRRPERSLWLASFLPRGYFCVTSVLPGNVPNEPCVGGEQRYAGLLNAAWEAALWTLDGGATYTTTSGRVQARQTTAFLNFSRRELWQKLRFDAGASAARGSLVESAALVIGLGAPLWGDMADVSLHYRSSLNRYRTGNDPFLEHSVGTRLWWAASSVLDLNGSAELLTGPDVDVLMLHVGAAYRPRF